MAKAFGGSEKNTSSTLTKRAYTTVLLQLELIKIICKIFNFKDPKLRLQNEGLNKLGPSILMRCWNVLVVDQCGNSCIPLPLKNETVFKKSFDANRRQTKIDTIH